MTKRDIFRDILFMAMVVIAGVVTIKDGIRIPYVSDGPKVDWSKAYEIDGKEFDRQQDLKHAPKELNVPDAQPLPKWERLPPIEKTSYFNLNNCV